MYTIKRYYRDGKSVFLDLIRDIFVVESREESVRQNTLLELLNYYKIPKEFIRVEENLSHYYKGARDRADIIVLHPKTYEPWILFEVKAPEVYICDDTLNQAKRYNEILKCQYVCLINQLVENWYFVDKEIANKIEKPKSLNNLLNKNFKFIGEPKFIRPSLKDCVNKEIANYYVDEIFVIGQDTPSTLHSFIINFYGFLFEDVKHVTEPIDCGDFSIVDDGIRNTTFGNAGGGTYDGYYRYYVIQFPNGEHNIISISIFGTLKTVNDPHWGTRNSYSSLIVAIDDFEKKHNTLQLNIDNNLYFENDSWKLKHDGKLTIGKIGSAKKKDVLDFCIDHIPDLVNSDDIVIGELPSNELFTWSNSGKFVVNLIRYGLIRDKYRQKANNHVRQQTA